MEQKIIRRIEDLSNEIRALAIRRDELLKELRMIDVDMEVKTTLIYEFKSVLEEVTSSEDLSIDQDS